MTDSEVLTAAALDGFDLIVLEACRVGTPRLISVEDAQQLDDAGGEHHVGERDHASEIT